MDARISPRHTMKTVEEKHTIPPLLIPVYSRRISNLKKVQRLVAFISLAHE